MHNQEQKALFFTYINQTYKSPLMKLLLQSHMKGLGMRERRYIAILVERKKERDGQIPLLTYLIIHRNEHDGYVSNLIKELFEDVDIDEYVDEFDTYHSELNELLEYLELPPLNNKKLVEKNLQHFQLRV